LNITLHIKFTQLWI